MTIQSSTSRIAYQGAGTTGPFAIPFLFYANTDLTVIRTDPTGFAATLSLGIDYNLSCAGNAGGGSCTTIANLAIGYTVQIILTPPLTQLSHYVSGATFPSATLEQGFDRSVQIAQRLYDLITRGVRFPDADSSPTGVLPPAQQRALTALVFDSNGNIAVAPITSIPLPTAADYRPTSDNTWSLGSTVLRWLNVVISNAVKFVNNGFTSSVQSASLTANRTIMLPDSDVLIGGSTINTQNTAYTLVLSDLGKSIVHTDANSYSYTVPPNSSVAFPIGSRVTLVNDGSGIITVSPGAGVTLLPFGNGTSAAFGLTQNRSTDILKIAADTWIALHQTGVAAVSSIFTGTLTGMASATTGTVSYRQLGGTVTVYLTAAILGTSSVTTMTMTGLPAAITPAADKSGVCMVTDNVGMIAVEYTVLAASNTINFQPLTAVSSLTRATGAFTTSGTKGLGADWNISYTL